MGDVELDSIRRHATRRGDLLVRGAGGDVGENFALARRQPRRALQGKRSVRLRRGRVPNLEASIDRAQRRGETCRGHRPAEQATRACSPHVCIVRTVDADDGRGHGKVCARLEPWPCAGPNVGHHDDDAVRGTHLGGQGGGLVDGRPDPAARTQRATDRVACLIASSGEDRLHVSLSGDARGRLQGFNAGARRPGS